MSGFITVAAGGCAPPIVVPLEEREIDRAYADAGIMPMDEYISKYLYDIEEPEPPRPFYIPRWLWEIRQAWHQVQESGQ